MTSEVDKILDEIHSELAQMTLFEDNFSQLFAFFSDYPKQTYVDDFRKIRDDLLKIRRKFVSLYGIFISNEGEPMESEFDNSDVPRFIPLVDKNNNTYAIADIRTKINFEMSEDCVNVLNKLDKELKEAKNEK